MYVDGKWVRFQRGRPRKIGGYKGIFLNASGISRGMQMTSTNGINYIVSGNANGLEQWLTDNDDGVGSGPYLYTLSNFTSSVNNLWQFDIGYDSTGGANNNLVGHPGQNLTAIDSTVNTPVLFGAFPGSTGSLSMSKVGVFTQTATANGTTTLTLSASNLRITAGQTLSGTYIATGATVVSVTSTTVIMSLSATGSGSTTVTFDNNIAVSGGCVVIHPYLFVYGNNGLIQNSGSADYTDFGSAVANANNVSTGKIVKGLPWRGGTTSPSGLFWSLDALIRVSYAPQTITVGGTAVTTYWSYDLISSQTSIMSSSSVIEYDGIAYWCGVDRFLQYNGVVSEIPNAVNQNYFFDNVNLVQRQKVWATKVPRYGEVWWFYPKGSATECTDAIIYNVREKTWYDAGQALGSQRSYGAFTEVFPKPIWGGNTPRLATVFTGSISGTTLTVSAVTSGTLNVGQVITFVNTTANPYQDNTYITALGSGTGGAGTYTLNNTYSTAVTSRQMYIYVYTLWQHESGTDEIYLTNVNAVQSYVETCAIGVLGGLVGSTQQAGQNYWTRVERIEPDFIQSGPMSVVVVGKGYADDVDQSSDPYYFDPDTLKVDMREQRRELRLHFESNVDGGTYQMGKVLVSMTTGDVRSTGNP
jgi:hypothetical protein